MKLFLLFILIILLYSCSSSGSFSYVINGDNVTLSKLENICVDCQNNNKEYNEYLSEISRLKRNLDNALNEVYQRYGYNAPVNKVTEYTVSHNIAHTTKIKEFNAFKDNKCYEYYLTFGTNGNIYIFINKPNYLSSSDGKAYSKINEMSILFNNMIIKFIPVNEELIQYYDSSKLFLHLVKTNASNSEIKMLMEVSPNSIKVKYDNTTMINVMILK